VIAIIERELVVEVVEARGISWFAVTHRDGAPAGNDDRPRISIRGRRGQGRELRALNQVRSSDRVV
jgi:hypothetical protein